MALENILSKINENTQSKLTELENSIRKESELILNDAAKESEKIKEDALIRSQKEAVGIKERAKILALLQSKQNLIRKKHLILNKINEDITKKILLLPKEEKRNIYKKWIIKNLAGKHEIVVSEKDQDLFNDAFISELNKEAKKNSKAYEIKLSPQKSSLIGGFILRANDYEIDFSIENIMQSLKAQTQDDVVKILF